MTTGRMTIKCHFYFFMLLSFFLFFLREVVHYAHRLFFFFFPISSTIPLVCLPAYTLIGPVDIFNALTSIRVPQTHCVKFEMHADK